MATEVRAGTFAKLFVELDAETKLRAKAALRELALVVEKQAKINASSGAHQYGTPTPAKPNSGPAVISGNLRRSITHTPVTFSGGIFMTKVGTATGFYPNYGSGKRTPANKYGYYLEKTGLGKKGVKYPFLMPAFKFAMGVPARLIYQEAFGSRWRMIM